MQNICVYFYLFVRLEVAQVLSTEGSLVLVCGLCRQSITVTMGARKGMVTKQNYTKHYFKHFCI